LTSISMFIIIITIMITLRVLRCVKQLS
jgi:hypothetical protein